MTPVIVSPVNSVRCIYNGNFNDIRFEQICEKCYGTLKAYGSVLKKKDWK